MITNSNSLADIEFRMTWKSDAATHSMRGLPRPETDKYFAKQRISDPVYAVWGQKR